MASSAGQIHIRSVLSGRESAPKWRSEVRAALEGAGLDGLISKDGLVDASTSADASLLAEARTSRADDARVRQLITGSLSDEIFNTLEPMHLTSAFALWSALVTRYFKPEGAGLIAQAKLERLALSDPSQVEEHIQAFRSLYAQAISQGSTFTTDALLSTFARSFGVGSVYRDKIIDYASDSDRPTLDGAIKLVLRRFSLTAADDIVLDGSAAKASAVPTGRRGSY
jgi:hypothetical protein